MGNVIFLHLFIFSVIDFFKILITEMIMKMKITTMKNLPKTL